MPRDIEKVRAARRRWYERNKDKALQKVLGRKAELTAWFREFKKNLACEECGESHVACLDFHHTDPSQKEGGLGQAMTNGWGKEKILEEVSKCKVLCANCHRKLHWEEKQAD